MDIVFRVSIHDLWAKFQALRDGEDKCAGRLFWGVLLLLFLTILVTLAPAHKGYSCRVVGVSRTDDGETVQKPPAFVANLFFLEGEGCRAPSLFSPCYVR